MKKVFLTVPQLPKHKQITFEDMLAGITDLGHYVMWSPTGTITRYVNASAKLENAKIIPDMLKQLRVYSSNWIIRLRFARPLQNVSRSEKKWRA